jgi:hypothetical protein
LVPTPHANPRWLNEFHLRYGEEFDWLGVELQGHVAVFTTAGFGPIPMAVDPHLTDVDAALDQVRQLPDLESPAEIRLRFGHYSDWHAYSAKGFYGYDWDEASSRRYERRASPAAPISVSQLPAEIRAVAQLVEFPVKFADISSIIVWDGEPPAR